MQFKHWFENTDIQSWLGNSVVKGIVYHGTDKKPFDQFQYQKSQRFVLFSQFDVESKGFFFAESPHDALTFGRNVAACYVKMVNPLLDPRRDKHLGVDRLPAAKEMHLLKILGAMVERDEKHGPFIDLGVQRYWLKDRRFDFAHQWIYNAIGRDGLDWDCLDNPTVIQRMKLLGYDGTFVEEQHTAIGRSIFVPDAAQVKIVQWVNGVQSSWGSQEDYYTKKTNGLNNFYSPDTKE